MTNPFVFTACNKNDEYQNSPVNLLQVTHFYKNIISNDNEKEKMNYTLTFFLADGTKNVWNYSQKIDLNWDVLTLISNNKELKGVEFIIPAHEKVMFMANGLYWNPYINKYYIDDIKQQELLSFSDDAEITLVHQILLSTGQNVEWRYSGLRHRDKYKVDNEVLEITVKQNRRNMQAECVVLKLELDYFLLSYAHSSCEKEKVSIMKEIEEISARLKMLEGFLGIQMFI